MSFFIKMAAALDPDQWLAPLQKFYPYFTTYCFATDLWNVKSCFQRPMFPAFWTRKICDQTFFQWNFAMSDLLIKFMQCTFLLTRYKDSLAQSLLLVNFLLWLQSWAKYFQQQTVIFVWNSTLLEKLYFYFSGIFGYYWQNSNFGSKAENQAIILWIF